jgi:hypothetical protein
MRSASKTRQVRGGCSPTALDPSANANNGDQRQRGHGSAGEQAAKTTALRPPPVVPKYIRVPRNSERCPFTGLARSTLLRLIRPCRENDYAPPVRSIAARLPGKKRGTRLIDFASLVLYLEGGDGAVLLASAEPTPPAPERTANTGAVPLIQPVLQEPAGPAAPDTSAAGRSA